MAVIRRTKTLLYDTEKRRCDTHPKAVATVYGRSALQDTKDISFVNLCAPCFKDHGVGIGPGLGQEIIFVDIEAEKPVAPPKRAPRHIKGTVTPQPLRGAAKKAAEAKAAAAKAAAEEGTASQPECGDTVSQDETVPA